MKKKKGKWLLSLVLSLAMIAGLIPGLASTVNADEMTDWPQIATFAVTDNAVYSADGSVKATVNKIEIVQFKEDEIITLNDFGDCIVGEVVLSINDPVNTSDGTSAEWPTYLQVNGNDWSMSFTDESLILDSPYPGLAIKGWKNDAGLYVDQAEDVDHMSIVMYDMNYAAFCYRVKMVPEASPEPAVTWPQLASFAVTDNNVYSADGSVKATVNKIEIVQFKEDEIITLNDFGDCIVGEVVLSINDPVNTSDGTSAEWPTYLQVNGNDWSMSFTDESLILDSPYPGLAIKGWKNDAGLYVDQAEDVDHMSIVMYDMNYAAFCYRVKMVPEGVTPPSPTNVAPSLKNGVDNPTEATIEVGKTWTIDLSTVFIDADGDPLIYTVRIGNGAPTSSESVYSYTPETEGQVTFIFIANDGKENSVPYTVNLTVSRQNIAPTIKSGISAPLEVVASSEAELYLDLSTIFEDADGDQLSFYVTYNQNNFSRPDSIFDADQIFRLSYVPPYGQVVYFRANDGKADSPVFGPVKMYTKPEGVTWPQMQLRCDNNNSNPVVSADGSIKMTLTGSIQNVTQLAEPEPVGDDYCAGQIDLIVENPVLISDESAARWPEQIKVDINGFASGDAVESRFGKVTLTKAEENIYTSGDEVVIYATDKNGTKYFYRVIAHYEYVPSSDCYILEDGVELLDASGNEIEGIIIDQDGYDFTITLPTGTDVSSLANWKLNLDISEGATVAKKDDASWANGQACGMALNTPATFTVTAEDGTTQDYTIVIAGEASPVFAQHALLLSGEIGVQFQVIFPDGFNTEGCYVDFVASDGRSSRVQYSEAETKSGYEGVFFNFNINALELADTITATLHYGEDKTIVSDPYAAMEYINKAKDYEQLKNIVNALQTYGYYMQQSGWNDNLRPHTSIPAPDQLLTDSDITAAKNGVSSMSIIKTWENAGLSEAPSFSLVLNAKTVIKVTAKPNSGVEILTPGYTLTGNEYEFRTEKIGPKKLGDTYTVTIETSQGTATVQGSAMSYVNGALNHPSFTQAQKLALSAYYYYYVAAMNYR